MEVTDKREIGEGVSVSVRLTDGEIQQIAERLVQLLPRHISGEGLIDAAEVARRLGISRSTVYEKAEELGAVRIGEGSRARLRFDPEGVATQLAARSTAPTGVRRPVATPRRRRRSAAGLLPIRGEAQR
jgi:excisionase family DNA binding protein